MLKTINSCSGTTSKELRDNINKKDITKDQIVDIVYAINRLAMDYSSICNGLLQYLRWITPVLAIDYAGTSA